MANGRLEFKIGKIEFVGEGEQDWVTEQLEKMLERIPALTKQNNAINSNVKSIISESSLDPEQITANYTPSQQTNSPKAIPENLSTFLRKKDCVDKQRRKFLGAAVWLQLNGKTIIKTKEVTDELKIARQIKITNPSHQLNQNINQGFCQKEGNGFYVTPEGVDNII
jgi:hypothetical protein